jgi:hypothetical protein
MLPAEPTPTSPTEPMSISSGELTETDKRGQDAICAIYKHKGLSFDDFSLQLLIVTLSKHNAKEWKALCTLQEVTQEDEFAKLIWKDATLSASCRRAIRTGIRARGVEWTPVFYKALEVRDTDLPWGVACS